MIILRGGVTLSSVLIILSGRGAADLPTIIVSGDFARTCVQGFARGCQSKDTGASYVRLNVPVPRC
jgi:hypothetical protein